MQYWALLLQRHRDLGKDGLTIPYIIGSQNYLPSEYSKQTIAELIFDIIENAPFEVNLRYCTNISTLILEKRKLNNAAYYPGINGVRQSNFSIQKFSENELGKDIDSIIAFLVAQFQGAVEDLKYSASTIDNENQRCVNWQEFSSEKDIPFIKACFKSL